MYSFVKVNRKPFEQKFAKGKKIKQTMTQILY